MHWPWLCSTPAASKSEDVARSSGGALGRRFAHPAVKDIMHGRGNAIPQVEALITKLQRRCLRLATKRDGDDGRRRCKPQVLLGVFTDGDRRRLIEKNLDPRAGGWRSHGQTSTCTEFDQ